MLLSIESKPKNDWIIYILIYIPACDQIAQSAGAVEYTDCTCAEG